MRVKVDQEKAKKLTYARLLPLMIPRASLMKGAYYVGRCRNASVARWDGEKFHHWRMKWGNTFIETIKHPEDEEVFDCFIPVARADGHEIKEIPLPEGGEEKKES